VRRENNDKATDLVTNSPVLAALAHLLRPAVYADELVLTAAQCINVVTDGNIPAIQQYLFMNDFCSQLHKIITTTELSALLRTLCASILVNMRQPTTVSTVTAAAVPLVASVIETDMAVSLHSLLPVFASVPRDHSAMPADITRWEHMVNAQRLALEIVTNLCSVDGMLMAQQACRIYLFVYAFQCVRCGYCYFIMMPVI